jgi:hypothetical protein
MVYPSIVIAALRSGQPLVIVEAPNGRIEPQRLTTLTPKVATGHRVNLNPDDRLVISSAVAGDLDEKPHVVERTFYA